MSQVLYELNEVAKQNGKDGKPVWIIIKGSVYDVSKFLEEHPGGEELIIEWAGKDATKAFNKAGHSSYAIKDLIKYKIGELVITSAKVNEATTPAQTQEPTLHQTEQKSRTNKFSFCCC